MRTFVPHTIWVLIPQRLHDEVIDLENHFFRVRRLFFGTYFFATLAVVADGNFLSTEAIWHSGRIGYIIILGAAIIGVSSTNRRVHVVLAIATLLAFAGFAVTRFLLPR